MTSTSNAIANNYKSVQALSKQLNNFFVSHGFSNNERQGFMRNPRQYAWKEFNYPDAPDGFKYLNEDDIRAAVFYGTHMVETIHKRRAWLKNVEGKKSLLQRHVDASITGLQMSLAKAFPSMSWIAESSMNAEPYINTHGGYYQTHTVRVPLTWNKKINAEEIAVVKAGDGMRVVLDATERKLDRLANEDISAYHCQVVKAKHGKAEMDEAWVMRLATSDGYITATHKEFSRCESLIRRRVKDTVVKELLGEF